MPEAGGDFGLLKPVDMLRSRGLSFAQVFGSGFFGLVILSGLGLWWHAWKLHQESERIPLWPSVEGQILASKVDTFSDRDGTIEHRRYQARVSYSYWVKKVNFRGQRVGLDSVSTSDSADAERIVRRFPVGTKVPVYYDPTDPNQAVLDKSSGGGIPLVILTGTMVSMMGTVGLVAVLRKGR